MPAQSIFGANLQPHSTGDVFFEPLTVKSTAAYFSPSICVFNDTTTKIGLAGGFAVPDNYSTGASIFVFWDTTSATTGGVKFDFDYTAIANTENAAATSGALESDTVSVDSTAATRLYRDEITGLTAGNFSTGDYVHFILFRDGATTGTDTLAAAVRVHGMLFSYTTG